MPRLKKPADLLERLVPVLLIASIGLAFAVGVLWQKVSQLEGGGGGARVVQGTADQVAGDTAANQPIDEPMNGKLTADQVAKIPEVTDKDHVRGSSNPDVYLIEYSDYQCPYCQQFHATALKIIQDYPNSAWVLRHYPLEAIHPNAMPAALASECVFAQGGNDAFWKFTDAVFDDQATTLADLPGTAAKVGVNKASVQKCLDDKQFQDVVNGDYQGGLGAGVSGTPGNFILNKNGDAWFIPGAMPYDQIKPMIDEALGQS